MGGTKSKGVKSTSISIRIMKLCGITALCASVIIAIGMVMVTGSSIEQQVKVQMETLAQQAADTVEASVDADFRYLEGLATNEIVYNSDDFVEQKKQLIKWAEERGVQDLGYADGSGITLAGDMVSYPDISERAYYKEAMAGHRYASDPFEDSTKEGVIIQMFSVPVYQNGDSSTGKVIGVLYQKVDGLYLSNITNAITFGQTGSAYMINAEGTNIAHMSPDMIQQNAIQMFGSDPAYADLIGFLQTALANEKGAQSYSFQGMTKYVGYARTTEFGWRVIVSAAQGELMAGINRAILFAIVITICVQIIAVLSCIITVRRISNPIKRLSEVNNRLSEGDLSTDVELEEGKKEDEVTLMTKSTDHFVHKLKEVIRSSKNASGTLIEISDRLSSLTTQSEEAADNICSAIEDVSQATVSQAMDVETATQQVISLEGAVADIDSNVHKLIELSNDAIQSEEASKNALDELIQSNEKTTEAFREISTQINATGVATSKISDAANLITEIASQTNLLSLNASIEAARAGDAGKGFAVVATEIQQLSIQSDEAANTIQQIIEELTDGSNKSIQKMDEALVLILEQQERLAKTETESGTVNSNVENMLANANVIKENLAICVDVKNQLNKIITNLSALSEENAASAEETNAAMEELNANIGIIAEAAKTLSTAATELNEDMAFWSLG